MTAYKTSPHHHHKAIHPKRVVTFEFMYIDLLLKIFNERTHLSGYRRKYPFVSSELKDIQYWTMR